MPIYTKQGDEGRTRLLSNEPVPKHDVRLHAIGSLDELNAFLGLAAALGAAEPVAAVIERIRHELFAVGGALVQATAGSSSGTPLSEQHVRRLERFIDEYEAKLPPLRHFIVPGGTAPAAALHCARTICRRAERWVCAMAEQVNVPPIVLTYLNRLGDLLFVLARLENHLAGVREEPA